MVYEKDTTIGQMKKFDLGVRCFEEEFALQDICCSSRDMSCRRQEPRLPICRRGECIVLDFRLGHKMCCKT